MIDTTVAATLANTIGGSGIAISGATLTFAGGATLPAPTGTFTGGASTVGFAEGIVLTNGYTDCVPGPNDIGSCSYARSLLAENPNDPLDQHIFDRTTLSFNFTSSTGKVFFRYVFASEEYTQFVGTEYNDAFQLLLNGSNIALLPGGAEVSINNVNCGSNSGFYRNNVNPANSPPEENNTCDQLGLDIQFDGLTTVLTATGSVVAGATNTFSFTVFDRGDPNLDSAVFIEKGSFSGDDPNPIPEPGSLLLAGMGLLGAAMARLRRRRN